VEEKQDGAAQTFREVAHLIAADIPLILETPAAPGDFEAKMDKVRQALPICAVA
jgi:endonuclease IV